MDAAAWIAVVPALLSWLFYLHFMRDSAEREMRLTQDEEGGAASLGSDWVTRWTLGGAALGVVSVAVSVLIGFVLDQANWAQKMEGIGSSAILVVVLSPFAALAFGIITRRSIRSWERHLARSKAQSTGAKVNGGVGQDAPESHQATRGEAQLRVKDD